MCCLIQARRRYCGATDMLLHDEVGILESVWEASETLTVVVVCLDLVGMNITAVCCGNTSLALLKGIPPSCVPVWRHLLP